MVAGARGQNVERFGSSAGVASFAGAQTTAIPDPGVEAQAARFTSAHNAAVAVVLSGTKCARARHSPIANGNALTPFENFLSTDVRPKRPSDNSTQRDEIQNQVIDTITYQKPHHHTLATPAEGATI